jgi:hypothetical protein
MKSGIGSQKEVLMLKVSILFWLLRMEDTLLHRMCLENEEPVSDQCVESHGVGG